MAEPATIVKCLVWDLDNTLWQGTLLEDAEVTLAEPVRRLIAELDSRGVLQAVASKNDHDPAWQRLEALGVAEFFVLPHIGWGPKSDSVRAIAAELNFALDTIAFVDDQPTERAEVAFHLPEVRCYDARRLAVLDELPEFSPPTVTVDARRRREMYQAGFRRKAAETDFQGPSEEFLRSLELVMHIRRASGTELSRVEELTLRTSQMNATGVHYSLPDLRALLADPRHEVLVATLADRFGPHGAVGLELLAKHERVWHLKLLATSCRVVSFGAGSVILGRLVDEAARAGVHLVADFRRTERNRMMEIAYRMTGFTDEACGCAAELAAPAEEGVQRLHLHPTPQAPPPTMELHAVSLRDG
ncbi:HAD-IIIC family phosphatase [Streptomyces corynorhini]|uniref:HAD-IIIC family phosphatase n=1 Tax=Streptomyces corynorhini TaxID=2282652 RepID=A0A370B5J8_9ACTN|nr:HAD-IIIC family phosphatase [Streptomyces corynorhini]RDG36861.1 HAD-IIIC family phosphatase [Streptomyces corynorhini]